MINFLGGWFNLNKANITSFCDDQNLLQIAAYNDDKKNYLQNSD